MVQQYGDPSARELLIRLPQSAQGTNLDQGSKQVVDALNAGLGKKFDVISTEIVGPVVGAELRRKGSMRRLRRSSRLRRTWASVSDSALRLARSWRRSMTSS